MIQIIAGEKGKGKTKLLLHKVNQEIQLAKGNVVYLDKSNKNMYELSNKIRLINVKDYLIENYHEFIGFICGMLSQDHDLEKVYLDSFLKIACIKEQKLDNILHKLSVISKEFQVDFIISISLDQEQIPLTYQKDIVASL